MSLLTIDVSYSGSGGYPGNANANGITGLVNANNSTYNVYTFLNSNSGTYYTINYTIAVQTVIYVLAVGGGGGGSNWTGGGGGGGGVVMTPVTLPAGTGTITVSVGAGGNGPPNSSSIGGIGNNTTITFSSLGSVSTVIAFGGGYGSGGNPNSQAVSGGSGGGGGIYAQSNGALEKTIYNNYANRGGNYTLYNASYGIAGGGGGAGTIGLSPNGGSGIRCFLPGIKDFKPSNQSYGTYYWGGGGGGCTAGTQGGNAGNGGFGGGGGGNFATTGVANTAGSGDTNGINPGTNGNKDNGSAGNGGTNTGGGGGGGWSPTTGTGGAGGSGIVIIAFPKFVVITSSGSVLTNPSLSTTAYNNVKGAFANKLVNYNYFGPIFTLRYNTDTLGQYTKNFYASLDGSSVGDEYLGNGTSLSSWLSTQSGANTTYAHVSKWYNQGMDVSFNCATQYTIASQPIYEVANKVMNFGYQGIAPSTNYFFNMPDASIPYKSYYSFIVKHGNITNTTNGGLIGMGTNFTSNTNNFRINSATGFYNYWYSNDILVTFAYAVGNIISFIASLSSSNASTLVATGVTSSTAIYTNAYGNGGLLSGGGSRTGWNCAITNAVIGRTTLNEYLNGQIHFLYWFNAGLSDNDRFIIENNITQIPSALSIIPGLILWLDAADTSSIASSSENVTQWNDKSGFGYNMIGSSSPKQPKTGTYTINGLNAIDCSTNTGSFSNSMSFPNTYSIFAVGYMTSSSGRLITNVTGTTTDLLFFGAYTNYNFATFVANLPAHDWWDTTDNTPNVVISSPSIMELTNDNTTLRPYVNGTAQNTKTGTTATFTGLSLCGVNTYGGILGEILIYNRPITSSERQIIEGYLATKWGLKSSLPSNHPYYSIAPALSTLATLDADPTMVYYYKFLPSDLNSSNQVYNYATKTYDLTLTGGATVVTGISFDNSKTASSLFLNNPSNARTQYATSSTLFTHILQNGFTFSGWFMCKNDANSYTRICTLLGGTNGTYDRTECFITYGSNTVYYGIAINNSSVENSFGYTAPLGSTNNTWVHIAMVISQWSSTNNFSLYINGALQNTLTNATFFNNSIRTMTIGTNGFGNPYYYGYINEYRIYNRALNYSEIQLLYNYTSLSAPTAFSNVLLNDGTTTLSTASRSIVNASTLVTLSWLGAVGATSYAYFLNGTKTIPILDNGVSSNYAVFTVNRYQRYSFYIIAYNSYGGICSINLPTNSSVFGTCNQWLDGSDLSTITSSGSNSQIISSWQDKSRNGTLFNNTGGYAPTMTNNNLNTTNSLTFTADNSNALVSRLTSITNITLPQRYTIFVVGKITSNTGNGGYAYCIGVGLTKYLFYGAGPSNVTNFLIGTGNGTDWNDIGAALSPTADISNLSLTAANNNYDGSAGTFQSYISGKAYGSKLAANAAVTTTMNFGAALAPDSIQGMNGQICEVIVMGSSLSTAYQQYIEGYLSWKWGLQSNLRNIPTSHPYGSTIPSGMAICNPYFTPNSLSGLQLWLDAADVSTITCNNYESSTASLNFSSVSFSRVYPTVSVASYSNVYSSVNYTIYAFKTVGTVNSAITVTGASASNPAVFHIFSVGGGGSGGCDQPGGGGGGGVVQSIVTLTSNDTVNITVGDGGTASGANNRGVSGANTTVTFITNTSNNVTAYGGGCGASYQSASNIDSGGTAIAITSIGSGGGGSGYIGYAAGGTTSTYVLNGTTYKQGYTGGTYLGLGINGGGGGAGSVGVAGSGSNSGAGGTGVQINTTALTYFNGGSIDSKTVSNLWWAGGGGGGGSVNGINAGAGGKGGGGGGSSNSATLGVGDTNGLNNGISGTVGMGQVGGAGGINTGGGGGGSSQYGGVIGGKGGSGIVLIAIPNSYLAGNGISLSANGNFNIYAYKSVGTYTNAITITGASPSNPAVLQIFSVGGGGSGGCDQPGGGGGGGVVQSIVTLTSNDTVNITVGDGGTASTANNRGVSGANSTVSFATNTSNNITVYGGGCGASYQNFANIDGSGNVVASTMVGSGGGGSGYLSYAAGGTATTYIMNGTIYNQGYAGGTYGVQSVQGVNGGGGGGGGGGIAGSGSSSGAGGQGVQLNTNILTYFNGGSIGAKAISNLWWAGGGGGGGAFAKNAGAGGKGGGGGGNASGSGGTDGVGDVNGLDNGISGITGLSSGGAGGINTGGGGGGSGGGFGAPGGKGGSGIVLVAVFSGFTPNMIAGLTLWMDASDLSTIVSSGSYVTNWNDKSGGGYNFTQSNATYAPTTGNTTLNSRNVLNFTSSKYIANSTCPMGTNYTIFAVGYTTSNGYGRLLNGTVSGDGYLFLGTGNTNTQFATFVGSSVWNDIATNSPGTSVASPCIMAITNNGATGGLIPYVNRSVQTAKNGTTTSFNGFVIGAASGGNQLWNGYIAEIIIYNSVLSDANRQAVENYLSKKWFNGISQWTDKSANNYSVIQSSQSNQPFYSNSLLNGMSGINFSNSSWLSQNAYNLVNFTSAPSITVFMVVTYTTASVGWEILNTLWFGGGLKYHFSFRNTATSGVTLYLSTNGATDLGGFQGSTATVGANYIVGFRVSTSNKCVHVNGLTTFSTGAPLYDISTSTGSFVLNDNRQINSGYNSNMFEYVAYNTYLSDYDAKMVEGYLAWKWGLQSSLPNTHPFYSYSPSTLIYSYVPAAPTQTCVNVSGTAATVVFVGSTGATSYTATSNPGKLTGTSSTTPITITGLSTVVTYSFTVTASNASGTSVASVPVIDSGLSSIVPAIPVNVVANILGTTATVTCIGSTNTTSFTATSSPGGLTGSSSTNTITIVGLTSGTTYTFTVTAANSAGTSAKSAISNYVLTGYYPPSDLSTISYTTVLSGLNYGNGTYTTSASVERNGSYTVNGAFWNPTNANRFWQVNLYPSTTTTTDYNGVVYTGEWAQIYLPSAILFSSYSTYNNAGNAVLGWTILGSNNGTTWFNIKNEGYPLTTSSGTVYFNLNSTNGYQYYRLIMTNPGTSGYPVFQGLRFYQYSIASVPDAPTNIGASVSGTTVTIKFNASYGATRYTAISNTGAYYGTSNTSPITIVGLVNGTISFTVTATNSAGTSVASAVSNTVTLTNTDFNNFNFALPAQSFNSVTSYWTSNTINNWTHSGRMFVLNGTGGASFNFTSCIVPQFLINQWVSGFSAGILSQYVYLYATAYVLSFWAAVRPSAYNVAHQFSVVIGGTTYFTSAFTSSNTAWKQYFVNFSISTSGAYNIVFNFTTSTSDSSIGITQLSLVQSFVNYNFALPSISTNTYLYTGTIPGWTVTNINGSTIIGNGTGGGFGFTTCPFTQFFIYQISGKITQSVYIYANSYTLSFWAAVRGPAYNTTQQVSVIVGGTTYFTSSFTISNTAWKQYFVNFPISTNGTYTIDFSFSGSGDTSIGIANILLYKPIYLNNQLSVPALITMRGLYAFKLLMNTYSGPIAKIRRASDGSSLDFYADISGNIGTTSYGAGTTLVSWLTSTTGYVSSWYDQSGLGNNMIQITTASQPRIILDDTVGICLYINIAGTNVSQLQTINNVFITPTVIDSHIILHHKALSYNNNITFSLNSPNSYGLDRFGAHSPWSNGIYYFDVGNTYLRIETAGSLIPVGTRVCLSGYTKSSTVTRGLSINDFTYYEVAGNSAATVSKAGFNFSDGVLNTNTYIYSFALFSKSLYNTNDEVFMKSLTPSPPPSQYIALYNIYTSKKPWGIYDANNWNSSTNVLPEARGNGRNVTSTGTVTKSSGSGNGATASITYISGSNATVLTWPAGSIPTNFTVCTITRYSGTNKGRIMNGSSNWLHGHWGGLRGVCHYDGWKTGTTNIGTQTDWLVCCGNNGGAIPNNILIDGVASGTVTGGTGNITMYINSGTYPEASDFQMSYVIIWNQVLTDAEMVIVSTALRYYMSSGIPLDITNAV